MKWTIQHYHIGRHNLEIMGSFLDDWFICWSPSQENKSAEGCWEDWVNLAEAIIEKNHAMQVLKKQWG